MNYGHVVISNNKKGIIPKLIRFFTNSNFSHCFIITKPNFDVEIGVEASSSGIEMCLFDKEYRKSKFSGYKVFQFNADNRKIDEALKKSILDLNKGYGTTELIWFVWRWLNKQFGKDIKNQDNWFQKGLICSEFTSNYIKRAGYKSLFLGFGRGSINAQDVLEICESNGDVFVLIESKD